MCGISGYYSGKQNLSGNIALNMAKKMEHRGPDNLSFYNDNSISLGHNRLSLLDLDPRSNQPFENEDFVLVYNGEIYNYLKIKTQLLSEGNNFHTQSDTEVLFKSLQNWGLQRTLGVLEGMFAFAWYNKKTRKLCIARDRIGIKPLFYQKNETSFAFSSEIKALMALDINKDLCKVKTLLMPLRATENSPHYTSFENIYQLEPGHWLEINNNLSITEGNYFNFRDYVDKDYYYLLQGMSEKHVIDHADELLNNAVKRMLVSDASVGTFVSGGVDSSLIAAIASKYQPINLYTANVKGKYSEYDYAKQLSTHLNLKLFTVDFEKNMYLDSLAKTTWHYESPLILHPNAVPFGYVSKLAQDNNEKAVLTGEGSDELYLGYSNATFYRYAKYILWPYNMVQEIYKKIPKLSNFTNINKGNPVSDLINQINGFEKKISEEMNLERFSFLPDKEAQREQTSTLNMLQTHLHSLLWRNDRIGMMNSIESRFPFIDENMLKFGINLPTKFKLMKNYDITDFKRPFLLDKGIIRKLSERYIPKNLAHRKKAGFTVNGNNNCKYEIDFLREGFWQNFTGMNNTQLEYMFKKTNPNFLSRICAVEVWGQLFILNNSIEKVQERINKYSKTI